MNIQSRIQGWLEECDVKSIRKFWSRIHPNLPQPKNDHETLVTIHVARTQSESIALTHRMYSHHWLRDRSLPSMLPDDIRPIAERTYPIIVEAVGISMNTTSSLLKPALSIVHRDVCNAVSEVYYDNPKPEPSFVKKRIIDVKNLSIFRLFGIR